jgi:hyaluronan synthase
VRPSRIGGLAAVVVALLAIIGFHIETWFVRPPTPAVLFFAAIAFVYLLLLTLAAKGRSFKHLAVAPGRVVAIVPTYNEDRAALRACVRSLLSGTVVPDVIHVVDDGSAVPAVRFLHPRVVWHRQSNLGKRAAQVAGLLDEASTDFILTVDSDSIVDKRALEEALRAMSDLRIQAVTATCLVANRTATLLTRLTDLEIVTGNSVMRRARSVLGVVAPTSGPFSLYRASVLFDNLEDYISSGTYGDDRRLTHYALMRGQVVACDDAVVRMYMPETISSMFRQRTRWFQGYFRYLGWELRNLTGPALWFRCWNLLIVVAFPVIVLYAFAVVPILHGIFFWEVLLYWLVLLYAQATHYLASRSELSRGQRLRAWLLLTPLLALVHWFVIRPAMYYSITRVRSLEWVTRDVAEASG